MKRTRKILPSLGFIIPAMLLLGALTMSASAQTADTTPPVVSNVIPADGATIYTNGTSTVTSISADYSDAESGIDPASVMVHLDGGNMLIDCPTQTASHVACNATVADLPAGGHTLDVYVMDLAGNLTVNHTAFTVLVDNQPPYYINLAPAGGATILTSTLGSLVFSLDYGDPDPSSGGIMPMVHVNDSHDGTSGAMITGCTKTPLSTSSGHYSCPALKAKRLHLGSNWMEVLLADKVGNNDYSLPSRMNYYTVVDDVAPAVSSVTTDSSTITASYIDPEPAGRLAGSATLASGIDTASVAVYFDGALLAGCSAAGDPAGIISCPTPADPAPGDHVIQAFITDRSGNSGNATGSYFVACVPSRPLLSLAAPRAYWGSYSDYQSHILSIDWTVANLGTDNAREVQLLTSVPNNGVSLITPMPAMIGNLMGGGSGTATLQYQVPNGVHGFRISNTASAADDCGYLYLFP